nr:MAG TPA: hypothetical protein [Caudoviricetes sp.]
MARFLCVFFNTPFEPTFLCVRPLPGPVMARF